ncbi:MAG: aminopeptidase P family protein [bacterium]
MFEKAIYVERRKLLKKAIKSGVVLFLGNEESAMNYPANTYPFRQDSTFLYYWGLDFSGLAAIIDVDNDEEMLFGYDYTVDDIVWMGPQETMVEKAKRVGVKRSGSPADLEEKIKDTVRRKRKVHFIPPYRGETIVKIADLTGLPHSQVKSSASKDLIRAVVVQRSLKTEAEVKEIETALGISYEMYRTAMRSTKPGLYEYEVAGAVEGKVLSSGSHVSFPIIFTIHGEVLHGHSHENVMKDGDLLILDCGAESPLYYASDITRTYPVNGKFSGIQKDIYQIVLAANVEAIKMIRPRIPFRDVHIHAAKTIAGGLKQLGFMKGDTDEAVAAGAHALFFPHGLGHHLGLDVHDMENFGEDYVGYDDDVKRSDQFGLAYLRLAKKLQPGYVVTVEPGIYFMPELFTQWKSQKKCAGFIDYKKVESHLGLGGFRVEDDVLVTKDGHRVLGNSIAKTVEEVEEWCG